MANASNLILRLLITAKDEASNAFGKLKETVLEAIAAFAGFLAVKDIMQSGVQAAADFESVLARIEAAGIRDRDSLQRLADAAKRLGVETGQGAQAAAEALEALVKSGLAAAEAIAALPAAMALAQGQGLRLDATAELLTNS
jgi:TP901 family phage tail tape measure protein